MHSTRKATFHASELTKICVSPYSDPVTPSSSSRRIDMVPSMTSRSKPARSNSSQYHFSYGYNSTPKYPWFFFAIFLICSRLCSLRKSRHASSFGSASFMTKSSNSSRTDWIRDVYSSSIEIVSPSNSSVCTSCRHIRAGAFPVNPPPAPVSYNPPRSRRSHHRECQISRRRYRSSSAEAHVALSSVRYSYYFMVSKSTHPDIRNRKEVKYI